MSVAEDIGSYLTSQGEVEGATGWTVGYEFMPDSPDKVILITGTGGPAPHGWSGVDEYYPTFQVRGRGDTPTDTKNKLKSIYDVLHKKINLTIDGTEYKYILAIQSSPIFIGQDTNRRHEYTQNYRAGINE
jgi:hypothetical protein